MIGRMLSLNEAGKVIRRLERYPEASGRGHATGLCPRARRRVTSAMLPNRYRAPPMRILEQKDIVQLLRSEVEKAGSQIAWAKKHGVDVDAFGCGVIGAFARPNW